MKQALRFRNPAPWMGALLVVAAVLALAACDSDVNFTGPQIPEIPPANADTVWVAATLTSTSDGGSCLEARLLYDGKHIGQNNCKNDGDGKSCAEMELAGYTDKSAGRHTLEIQVLRQSPAEVVYRAKAELRNGAFGPAFQWRGKRASTPSSVTPPSTRTFASSV